MNLIARMELKFAYYDVAIQHVSHYTTGNRPTQLMKFVCKCSYYYRTEVVLFLLLFYKSGHILFKMYVKYNSRYKNGTIINILSMPLKPRLT